MATANPTVAKGQRSIIHLLSGSHGAMRQGLVEAVDLTPSVSGKKVMELSSEQPGKLYNVHEGGAGKIDFMEKNQGELFAALMDYAPGLYGASGMIENQSEFQDFHVLVNEVEDSTTKIFASKFAYKALGHGISAPMPAADAMKRSLPFQFIRMFSLIGLEMRYVRGRTDTAQLDRPDAPTLVDAGAASLFTQGQLVYVRVATSRTANAAGDPVPAADEPLTEASDEVAIQVAADGDQITVTIVDPAPYSAAVYVGSASGQEVFAGWIAPGSTDLIVTTFPPERNPLPPRNDQSGAFATAGDLLFAAVGGFTSAVDLSTGKLPTVLRPTGLRYVCVLKNGVQQDDGFAFSDDGKYFYVPDASPPANTDVWELILPVVPTL